MNHYSFHCPVKKDATMLTHCEEVHSKSMQGNPQNIEDKICALAHQCWMCPARNAFRVGGPWSHYDKKPHAAEPMNNPARLPKDLVTYSLSHTTPRDSDYRRCGMWGDEVRSHDDLFRSIQVGSEHQAPAITPAPKRKSNNLADMVDESDSDLGAAVTELAKKERQSASGSASKKKTTPDKQKTKSAPQRSAQRPADAKPKMSLAERAKMMKQKS